ncbi:hypothetical protein PACTADRAFT_37463 [Pachysolen tannophilus NRRL Y-2460]|uniref:Dephospho-CoA kinase n=1 Tax=Pachysolen tannophilus NRRL Y-2460 TaxID=669874 RepID=A0A1E4U1R4_PACTA|nr:hypothetical protein PACTADRAFT_37463 [Pachysolen tannophilus NRRL Y-2460]
MLIVGLTGGIASGKSTVSTRLSSTYSLTVIDADKIAREVVEPKKPAYNEVVKYFEPLVPNLLNEDGSLNRAELGKFVFQNKQHLTKLNSIVHPAVRKEIFIRILKAWFTLKKLVILDIPLLFESGMDKICGLTLLVSCPRELQLQRLLERNPELTLEDAENRIRNQMSNELKIAKSDKVLKNDQDLKNLYDQIETVLKEITPSTFKTYLYAFIPPVGALAAGITVLVRYFKNQFANKNEIKKIEYI